MIFTKHPDAAAAEREPTMRTESVRLPPELVAFVEGEMKCDGLRRLLRDKLTRKQETVILRREVGRGLDQAREGRLSRRSVRDIAIAVRRETNRTT
jgi:antitoxin ParD1/3/4